MMPSFLTTMCATNLAESSFYHQEQMKPRHEPPADPTTSKHTTSVCGHHEAQPPPDRTPPRHVQTPEAKSIQRYSTSISRSPWSFLSYFFMHLLSEHSTSQTMFRVCLEVISFPPCTSITFLFFTFVRLLFSFCTLGIRTYGMRD